MLQIIREKTKGLFALIIFGILSLTFALWGVQYYIKGRSTDAVIAQVNHDNLTQTQWEHTYKRLRSVWQAEHGKKARFTKELATSFRKQALDELIMTTALSQSVRAQGYYIAPEVVGVAIKNLPLFQKDGEFSQQRFAQLLHYLSYSEEDFSQEMQARILTSQFRQGIMASAFVLPTELKKNARLANQTRDIRYALLPAQTFITNAPITKSEIQTYYQQHQQDFLAPERVDIAYLQLSPDTQLMTIADPTLAQLRQFYQDNTDIILPANQTTIPPFSTVHAKVKKAWIQQRRQKAHTDAMELLSELTYMHPDTLAIAADKLHLPIKEIAALTRAHNPSKPMAHEPALIQAAFSEDVLQQKNNSSLIELSDGSAVVLRIKSHTPATVRSLSVVRGEIVRAIQHRRAKTAVANTAQTAVKALQAGRALPHKAQSAMHWQTLKGLNRHNKHHKATNPLILQKTFTLPEPTRIKPVFDAFALPNGDYVIIHLQSIHAGSPETPKQLKQLKKNLLYTLGLWEYGLSVKQVMQNSKIVHKQGMLSTSTSNAS